MLSLWTSHRTASPGLGLLPGLWVPDWSVTEGVALMCKPAQASTLTSFCSVRLAGKPALFPPPVFCAIWTGSDVSLMPTRSHYRVARQTFAL